MSLFKICTCCKNPWFTRDEFLSDNHLDLVGYQVNFTDLELGYFLFNHSPCQSTIAVPAGQFSDLYDGPIFTARRTGSESCPGYCKDRNTLDPCAAECECAYVREIVQILRHWPKNDCSPAKIANEQCRA